MSTKVRIVPFAPRSKRSSADVMDATLSVAETEDCSDHESQRVLIAAARIVAYELGCEAAREYFADLTNKSKVA
jgi:hypothetical protein